MSLGMHYNTEAGEHDLHSYVNDVSVFNVVNGHVKAPIGIGLGIEINEDAVRRVSKLALPWLPKEFYGMDGSIREW
jgi:galactonate dehydratase